ncbi:centrosomal protein of isoform A [Alligator mississippiensis]|uniref:Centrosomal protein of isoform A n=1 Tax=Alligator mississippiensis TaxID=8496 RepID=A0A151P281_ALLMI|nr:centrosomal protein of isoform A [Alligator mississippiensis]
MILKEEYERRRKLRLQQVREQERYIALQIRQEVKQRKDEELHQLAENLKAEWLKAQDQKIKALEKLYLSSLRAVGEGHRQAKENEPDLESLAKQREERKQRAEKRHKEALKEQKKQKEKLQTEQTWKVNARKHAICVEKARAAKIASLPPPQPYPFENFEVKKIPTVKVYNADNFSVTHHHLSEPYVDREMDTEQPDAQLVAEEEAKRLKELQKEEERGRREQLEKAHVRGSHALKMVHLAQDRERLMKELEQMQNMDRACRRQIVAQMPPQLFVPSYRRVEIKDDWQRELEMAFEDMYSGDRKMKGDMILQLEPQPLPTPSDQSQDDELDISLEPDSVCERQPRVDEVIEEEVGHHSQSEKREEALQPQSKLALKKLLNKIRSQKDQWASKSEAEVQSDIQTIESGTLPSEERLLCDLEPGHNAHGDSVSEAKESLEILEQRIVAGNSVLIHPQEQAAKIRMEAERQKQNEQIEQQKQEQLALLKQIEEKRMCLEDDYLKIRMQAHLEEIKTRGQEEKDQPSHLAQMNTHSVMNQQTEVEHRTETAAVPETTSPRENDHVQIIRNYQQRLLQQNRLHKQQRMQEELLIWKQTKLKEQMQRKQEAVKDLLNKQVGQFSPYREMTETQKPDQFNLFKGTENYQDEVICGNVNKYNENGVLSWRISPAEQIEQSQKIPVREQKCRTSKPPLAKIKLGLNLEQHELSVIPEVDTPRSWNVSLAGKPDSPGEETSFSGTEGELTSNMCSHESLNEERDLSRVLASSKEQSSNDSLRQSEQSSSSWHELQMVDAESLCDPGLSQDSVIPQHSPVFSANTGRGIAADSGLFFSPNCTVALPGAPPSSLSSQACLQEATCNLSSTTISTGSFLTSKKLDISPANSGLSSNNTEDRILRETVNSPWNSSASPMSTAQQGQGDSSEVSESQLPAEENVVSKRRSVQRIIDKYTKDFNWLPENNAAFHAPAVGLDLSDMERHFPHFHRQLFQPLEQSPDLDLSSSLSQYKISQDSKDCSKSSSFSTESQDTSTFLETTTSSRKMRNNNPRSCHEMKGLNKVSLQAEESLKENITLGSEESFHPLQLESTLNENGQSAEKTVDLSIVPESSSEQNPEIKNAESERCISLVGDQYEELRRNIENINFQSSVESLRSQSLSSLEEHSSFDQLNTTQIAVNKTPLAELSLKEDGEFGALCFDTVTPDKYQELNKTPVIAREANTLVEVASQRSTNVAEEEQGFLEAQMSCSMSRETYSKISAIPVEATVQESDPVLEMHEKQSHHSVLTISSGPCSSQAWVPVWETESGHGIMEEPELTLLSSNDITVAESDTDSIGQEEKRENEISTPACADQSEFKSCSEKRDFFPLEPKADCSIFTQPDCSAVTKRSREDQSLLHQSGVMLLEFTSTPASLQEAFLKKKKNFIHKSSERIQEIKNRESKKPQAKLFQRNKTERFHMLNEPSPTSGAAVSQLKKVGEVKVCSPEDRRSAETEIHQRASRLYNQLTEVKIRKEEKTRQEAYARNREKAKEFQKKTLEKLRARKTH